MIELLATVSRETIEGPLLGPAGFIVAFLVGTVSFFSPCIVPLVPGYLSFVSGLSGDDVEGRRARARTVAGVALFVAGFATMFSALGAATSLIGGWLLDNLATVNRVAGVVVIVMGLAFLVPSLFPFLERERRPLMAKVQPGLLGAFPLGLAFAAGWTPCVGPGLGVMIGLGTGGSAWHAALLLFFFSVGFGVWFILAALGLRKLFGANGWLRRNMRSVQAVGGVFMVGIGLLLVTNQWDAVMAPLRSWIDQFQPPV